MKKNIIISILITLICGVVLYLAHLEDKLLEDINSYYQVYLKGNKIGVIENEKDLYNLIDYNQSAIKKEYNVKSVYPPTDLRIVAMNTYNGEVDNIKKVYQSIEDDDDFTIKGYVVTIRNKDKKLKINVLNKNVFINATKKFVQAFLDENEYSKYINNMQEEIVDTGRIIENMKFSEDITIKEAYISVNEHIYTDELELTKFLLFGENPKTNYYTVKLGDTIESISEANKLNVEEFLIANTNYKDKDAILRVGDKVNVTLISPQLTYIYDLYEISDEVVYFEKTSVVDKSKKAGFSEITTAGQNGINRVTEKYSVTNGERSQTVKVVKNETIKEVVNQVTTKGPAYTYNPGSSGGSGGSINNVINPVNISGDWGWPTNKGYVITSYWGYRWYRMHQGIDISGAGNFGSPIYAAADGVVTTAFNACPSRGRGYGDPCGGQLGNSITINHQNGYFTTYAHLHQTFKVRAGQKVRKGQIIGYMGNSGSSTGAHLHFAVSQGKVGNYFNPMRLYS